MNIYKAIEYNLKTIVMTLILSALCVFGMNYNNNSDLARLFFGAIIFVLWINPALNILRDLRQEER